MNSCMVEILEDFETNGKEDIDNIFDRFMVCFGELGAEKLEYPNEFITDVKLFHEGFKPIIDKFEDREIRYLMISDFYDFCRLTKRYMKRV